MGQEAPVTLENCRLGRDVELKGGYFCSSVFLDGAGMGMGAHVREGCLLEEQACGAHTVGLKQTILFPFVTLGSLINFCDCFMAGGASRQNHSEVGSSYIHFNFTPDADKATPSLIGDVPRGVMLNQPPIFLGGQGGIVGPLRIGYGSVVAAGSILRKDYPQGRQLIVSPPQASSVRDFLPAAYPHFRRRVENNILYLANLKALEAWYTGVRKPFLETQEFGALLCLGALEILSSASAERLKRLKAMAQKAASCAGLEHQPEIAGERRALVDHLSAIEGLFSAPIRNDILRKAQEAFLEDFSKSRGNGRTNYLETIQSLPVDVSAKGVQWLASIVDDLCKRTAAMVPSMNLFEEL